MHRFFIPEKKINTQIFFGSSKNTNNDGGIKVRGDGDKAIVTFYDKDRNETAATLKVLLLKKLKKTKEYLNLNSSTEEVLINNWQTKKDDHRIIVYSSDKQLAFIFTCEGNAGEMFPKLLLSSDFNQLDYFKELHLCHYLSNTEGIHRVEDLMKLKGMNDERLQLLLEHHHDLNDLGKHNITLPELTKLNDNLFKLLLTNYSARITIFNLGLSLNQLEKAEFTKLIQVIKLTGLEINDILKFLTMEQILGIDHTPKKLDVNNFNIITNQKLQAVPFGEGTRDGFKYHYEPKLLTVQDEKSLASFRIDFGTVTDKKEAYDLKLSCFNAEPLQLLHRWYILKTNSDTGSTRIRLLYCPKLSLIHRETIDSEFPEKDFDKNSINFMLMWTPLYKEKAFIDHLNKMGYNLSELKKIPGMTIEKLELILQERHNVEFLLGDQVQLQELAQVDINHLAYLLNNSNAAKKALNFVNPRELLGLPTPLIEEKIENQEENRHSKCSIS